jgi:hypothetical protein
LVFAVSSTVYVPKKQLTCPTGVRGLVLVPSDFGPLAAIICQEKWPFSSNMAIPLTPGPHGSCFMPSSVWSYTDSDIQVPTISFLRVFCWPSASLGRKAIPRQRNVIVVIVSVLCRFIVFIVLSSVLPHYSARFLHTQVGNVCRVRDDNRVGRTPTRFAKPLALPLRRFCRELIDGAESFTVCKNRL